MIKQVFNIVAIATLPLIGNLKADEKFRESVLKGSDRPALLAEWVRVSEGKDEAALIKTASDPVAGKEERIGCAVLLLETIDLQRRMNRPLQQLNFSLCLEYMKGTLLMTGC